MLQDDFKYTGKNERAREFVETVNQIARLLNGLTVDMGANGSTDIVQVSQGDGGLKLDFTQVYIPTQDEVTPP